MPRFPTVQPVGGLPASVPVPRIPEGAFGAGTAQALGRLGGVLTALGAEREAEATRLRRERALTEFGTADAEALDAVRDRVRRETDPDRARSLVDEGLRALDDAIADTPDPTVREARRRQAMARARALKVDVGDRFFALERDRGRAAIREGLEARVGLAVRAPNPVERTLALGELDLLGRTAVSQGLFSAEEMIAEQRTAREAIGQGLARSAILADPEAAEAALADAEGPLGRLLPDRDRLLLVGQARVAAEARRRDAREQAERLETALAKDAERAEETLERTLTLQALEGQLSHEQLADLSARNVLTDERFRRVLTAVERARSAGGVSDPRVRNQLEVEIRLGRGSQTAILRSRQAGLLADADVIDLLGKLDGARERQGFTFAKRVGLAEEQLRLALRRQGAFGVLDPTGEERVRLALEELATRVDAGEDPLEVAPALIPKYRNPDDLDLVVPPPRFATEAALLAAWEAGDLTKTEYLLEGRRLRERRALEARRRPPAPKP